jgi:hypothetical protein
MAFTFAASRATAMIGPHFPVIVGAAARLKAKSFLIDGEVVIARDDRTPRGQHVGPKGNIILTPVEAGLPEPGQLGSTKPKASSALAVLIVRVWGRDRVGVPCPTAMEAKAQ